MWDRVKSIPFIYIWGTLGTLQPMLGMEEWPLMMQTSIAHPFLPNLIHCPKPHRSDPCHLPRGRFFQLGWGSDCFVWFFFSLHSGQSIHNLRSDLNSETQSFFFSPFSAQLTPDAETLMIILTTEQKYLTQSRARHHCGHWQPAVSC